MSLVAEILSSIKQVRGGSGAYVAGDGVCMEVADLSKRASDAKVAVINALNGQYTQLCSALQDSTALQTRVEHNLHSLTALHASLSGDVLSSVASSSDMVSGVAAKWQQAVEELKVAQQLLTVHEALRKAGEDCTAGQFYAAAQGLTKVEVLVSLVDPCVEVLPSILEEVEVKRTTLLYYLAQVWTHTFKWEEDNDLAAQEKTITLSVRTDDSQCEQSTTSSPSTLPRGDLCTVLASLHALGEMQYRLQTLAKDICNNFLRVALSRPTQVTRHQQSQSHSLSLTFPVTPSTKPRHHAVFTTIVQVLRNLNEFGFDAEFETGSDGEKTSLMKLIGEELSDQFTSLLISDCLAVAVPYSRKDLDQYDIVRTDTQALHRDLVSTGFYSPSERSILEYAANVDTVFSDKACAHRLTTARDLTTKPLHDAVSIAPKEGYPPLAVQDENGLCFEKSTLRLEKLLAAKTFHMPACQVSKSACALVDLLYDTLEEACKSSAPFAGRLVCTVRNVLELYNHVTPTAHATTLETIPQHAALVHNNCMFIANHCYLLQHQFKARLPSALRTTSVTSYSDIAYQISCTGTELFCTAMQRHKKALLGTIGQAQGFGEVPSGSGVRQCLHQLQQLRNVWHGVLPHAVYNKAMATLVNSVVKELVERVLGLEDISEESAVELTETLTILIDNGPQLFPVLNPVPSTIVSTAAGVGSTPVMKEGVCGVRQWGQYQELLIVLAASLRELQDRWADGKGPLATYFTPDQAKSLIRALFQNTDRRSQLLARITL